MRTGQFWSVDGSSDSFFLAVTVTKLRASSCGCRGPVWQFRTDSRSCWVWASERIWGSFWPLDIHNFRLELGCLEILGELCSKLSVHCHFMSRTHQSNSMWIGWNCKFILPLVALINSWLTGTQLSLPRWASAFIATVHQLDPWWAWAAHQWMPSGCCMAPCMWCGSWWVSLGAWKNGLGRHWKMAASHEKIGLEQPTHLSLVCWMSVSGCCFWGEGAESFPHGSAGCIPGFRCLQHRTVQGVSGDGCMAGAVKEMDPWKLPILFNCWIVFQLIH